MTDFLYDFMFSGAAAGVALAVLGLEVVLLTLVRIAGRPWIALLDLVLMTLPGALLLLALIAALRDLHWAWLAACLTAAWPLHLLDLRRRAYWQRVAVGAATPAGAASSPPSRR